ncbi:hypothetical protein ACT7CX_00180 [Bacillus cereus]|uniref:hypothetical protein n=1 Tax=Bacillus TaxID=1386 RepID=UPI000995DAAB|nr:hypothetical protein [Bacillus cereus]
MTGVSVLAYEILVAMFNEQEKEDSNMKSLTPSFFKVDSKEFASAVNELEEYGYIAESDISFGGQGNLPLTAWLDNAIVTNLGALCVKANS